MLKLHTPLSAAADELTYTDGILAINGVDYDLSALNTPPEPDEEGNTAEFTDLVWVDASGLKHAKISVDFERQFLFLGDNPQKFYDWDNNGVLDEETELPAFVEVWNQTEEQRREFRSERLKK